METTHTTEGHGSTGKREEAMRRMGDASKLAAHWSSVWKLHSECVGASGRYSDATFAVVDAREVAWKEYEKATERFESVRREIDAMDGIEGRSNRLPR